MRCATALGILAACLFWGCTAESPGSGTEEPRAVANAAPDFTLLDLEGNEVTLSDLRGKTVIIDFWATWCPPCIFQVPELNAFWKANRAAGDIAVLGVAVDVEGAEVVAPWAEAQDIEYTILIGDEKLAKRFGSLGFPTLVIVAPDGSIDSLHVGLIELDDLIEIVAPLRS